MGNRRQRKNSMGQAMLSFILLVSGIIIEVAIAGGFIAYALSSSGRGEQLSARAFGAAGAGIQDTTIRLARDKEWALAGPLSYVLSVGTATTLVQVSVDLSNGSTYRYQATSTGSAGTRSRRLAAVFAVDRVTGDVHLQSLAEIPF